MSNMGKQSSPDLKKGAWRRRFSSGKFPVQEGHKRGNNGVARRARLAFSRQQRMAPEAVNLNQIITGMGELLRTAVGATNRIETVLADPLSSALVDPSQIELVILNSAINARDAMPGGGTITIGTSNVRLGAPKRPEEPSPGDYVMCARRERSNFPSNARVRARGKNHRPSPLVADSRTP
jgi:hypothetical protein